MNGIRENSWEFLREIVNALLKANNIEDVHQRNDFGFAGHFDTIAKLLLSSNEAKYFYIWTLVRDLPLPAIRARKSRASSESPPKWLNRRTTGRTFPDGNSPESPRRSVPPIEPFGAAKPRIRCWAASPHDC